MRIPRRGWNPKRLGTVHSKNGPHEVEIRLYLTGRTLEIVAQVNEGGIVKGTTAHRVKLPEFRHA